MSLQARFQMLLKKIQSTEPSQPPDPPVSLPSEPEASTQDADFQAWFDQVSPWFSGFSGKRVLEVGCDAEGALISAVFRLYHPEEAIGMNLLAESRQIAPNCRLETGDIRQTHYPDNYFDLLISSSAFEHIQPFDTALAEMYRILKPGGFLFSNFGPIWSCSYGHHLWLVHEGELLNYWTLVLPPYAHLLMSRTELKEHLAGQYSQSTCDAISEYILNSPEQNQLFYEDYEAIVSASSFEVLLFKGYDVEQLDQKYSPALTPEILQQLSQKYPNRKNFWHSGITMLLHKPDSVAVKKPGVSVINKTAAMRYG